MSAKNAPSVSKPSRRCILPFPWRLPPARSPSQVIPGIINQKAYNGLRPIPLAVGVGVGCAVVVMFSVADCGPLNVIELEGAKLQPAPAGKAPQARETVDPNTGFGDNCKV